MTALAAKIRAVIEANTVRIPIAGCWLWTAALSDTGYGSFRLKEGLFTAHRASYSAFVGPIPDGLWVLHRCDTRACCNPEHLFTGTRQDNIADASRKGRLKGPKFRPSGLTYARPLAILDEPIRLASAQGHSTSAMARMFNVDRRTIYRALKTA